MIVYQIGKHLFYFELENDPQFKQGTEISSLHGLTIATILPGYSEDRFTAIDTIY